MRPVQFNTYLRRENGDEFRFIGYAQVIHDGEEPRDVCLMAPVCSGFEIAAEQHKRTPEHTVYYIVEPDDFAEFFDEGSPARPAQTEGISHDHSQSRKPISPGLEEGQEPRDVQD